MIDKRPKHIPRKVEQRILVPQGQDIWIGELKKIPGRRVSCTSWIRIFSHGLDQFVVKGQQAPVGYKSVCFKLAAKKQSVDEIIDLNWQYFKFFNERVLWANQFCPVRNDLVELNDTPYRFVEQIKGLRDWEKVERETVDGLLANLKFSPIAAEGINLAFLRAKEHKFKEEVDKESRRIAEKEYRIERDKIVKERDESVSRLLKENEELREILASKGKPLSRRNMNKTEPYVYLMKDNHNGLYKIGKSTKPKFREKTLQSEKPSIEMVFHTKERSDFNEDILHREFSEFRIRGEWFDLSPAQVRYICHQGGA